MQLAFFEHGYLKNKQNAHKSIENHKKCDLVMNKIRKHEALLKYQ